MTKIISQSNQGHAHTHMGCRILPMQQNRIRIFGLSFMRLGSIWWSNQPPQNTTLRYDRSTTCNCIMEVRTALLIPVSFPLWRPVGVQPTVAEQRQGITTRWEA